MSDSSTITPKQTIATPESMLLIEDIPILYQDDDLLIVDKPANLLTVPGRGIDKQDCLIHRLKNHFPNARIVHRLDMATSGVVVIALNHPAQAGMGKLFEKRQVQKTYIAVVAGKIIPSGNVDLPLICDWDNRPKQKVDHEYGKPAQTTFKRLSHDETNDTSIVELTPLTGRSHQLRVHMLAIGHPILGDYFYAPTAIKGASERLLLHAKHLQFMHPITNDELSINTTTPF